MHVPTPIVSRALRALVALMKSKAPATWDEAELMEVSMLAEHGTADAEALGVAPGADGRGARGPLAGGQALAASSGRCAHGLAVSSWVASASSAPSWAGWPTSCTESGVAMPSSRSNSGIVIAGWPLTLNSAVNGVNCSGAPERAHRVGRVGVHRVVGDRRLCQRRGQQRVVADR